MGVNEVAEKHLLHKRKKKNKVGTERNNCFLQKSNNTEEGNW